MLVKVIIYEDGQIVREDNGEVVGEKAFLIGYDFFSKDNKLIPMHYGYFFDDTFNELCQLTSCSHECLSQKHPNCRYASKGNETEGFYFLDGEDDEADNAFSKYNGNDKDLYDSLYEIKKIFKSNSCDQLNLSKE